MKSFSLSDNIVPTHIQNWLSAASPVNYYVASDSLQAAQRHTVTAPPASVPRQGGRWLLIGSCWSGSDTRFSSAVKGRSPQGGGESSECKKWRVVSPGGRGQELLPPCYRRNGTLEGTNKSVILRSHLPLFTLRQDVTLTGRCHFQSHTLVWADNPHQAKQGWQLLQLRS